MLFFLFVGKTFATNQKVFNWKIVEKEAQRLTLKLSFYARKWFFFFIEVGTLFKRLICKRKIFVLFSSFIFLLLLLYEITEKKTFILRLCGSRFVFPQFFLYHFHIFLSPLKIFMVQLFYSTNTFREADEKRRRK